MSRPVKKRRVCSFPNFDTFGPIENVVENTVESTSVKTSPFIPLQETKYVFLGIDEYEVVRLIDLERLTQQECSELIKVARSTIQRIYESAKVKIADAIVNGKILRITGGDIELCKDYETSYNCQRCNGRRHRNQNFKDKGNGKGRGKNSQ